MLRLIFDIIWMSAASVAFVRFVVFNLIIEMEWNVHDAWRDVRYRNHID